MAELTCRLIEENGTKAWLRVFWDDDCPNCQGGGHPGYHNAKIPLTETDEIADWELGGQSTDYPNDRWPSACDHCNTPVPVERIVQYAHGIMVAAANPKLPYNEQVHLQVFRQRRYSTASGRPEPGDMYYTAWQQVEKEDGSGTECSCTWSNCDGRHLYVVLPNGKEWDVDGRAKNCTLPKDKTHRCWVRSGNPPNVTAGKSGHTCGAGAGSIAVTGWHGFLRGGKLIG